MLLLPVFLVAMVALVLGATAPDSWAENGDEMYFEVADVYAELNDTDGDLGFHALIDGEDWKYLEIEDPKDRSILSMACTAPRPSKTALKRSAAAKIHKIMEVADRVSFIVVSIILKFTLR